MCVIIVDFGRTSALVTLWKVTSTGVAGLCRLNALYECLQAVGVAGMRKQRTKRELSQRSNLNDVS